MSRRDRLPRRRQPLPPRPRLVPVALELVLRDLVWCPTALHFARMQMVEREERWQMGLPKILLVSLPYQERSRW